MKTHLSTVFMTMAMAMPLAGCSEEAKPDNQNGGTADGTEDGFEADGSDGPVSAAEVFTLWCKGAGETKLSTGEMKKYYDRFCKGGKPTSLFAKSLPGVAFTGSGDPSPKKLDKTVVEGKDIIVSLGTAIKIPISIKTHFDKVGPKGGDSDAQEKLGEAQGAKTTVEIKKEYSKDGKHHVRGWLVYTKNEKKESGISIVTENEARTDQFMLSEGKAYMYTSYVTKAVKGIKETDLFTAGVQVGNSAYLITQAYIVADSKGAPQSVAEGLVMKTAKGLMKSMYEAASKEK